MELIQAIKDKNVEGTETILKDYLKNNPDNIEMWLKLCLTELASPFEDYVSALKCLENVHKICPNHLDSLILEGGIEWHNYGFISEELYNRLSSIVSAENNKMAIIYYIQSWYFEANNNSANEKISLIKSVETYDQYAYPCYDLGMLLLPFSREKGIQLIEKAIENVVKIYHGNEFYDFTDVDTYIAEYITGTAISDINYESMTEMLEKQKSQM